MQQLRDRWDKLNSDMNRSIQSKNRLGENIRSFQNDVQDHNSFLNQSEESFNKIMVSSRSEDTPQSLRNLLENVKEVGTAKVQSVGRLGGEIATNPDLRTATNQVDKIQKSARDLENRQSSVEDEIRKAIYDFKKSTDQLEDLKLSLGLAKEKLAKNNEESKDHFCDKICLQQDQDRIRNEISNLREVLDDLTRLFSEAEAMATVEEIFPQEAQQLKDEVNEQLGDVTAIKNGKETASQEIQDMSRMLAEFYELFNPILADILKGAYDLESLPMLKAGTIGQIETELLALERMLPEIKSEAVDCVRKGVEIIEKSKKSGLKFDTTKIEEDIDEMNMRRNKIFADLEHHLNRLKEAKSKQIHVDEIREAAAVIADDNDDFKPVEQEVEKHQQSQAQPDLRDAGAGTDASVVKDEAVSPSGPDEVDIASKKGKKKKGRKSASPPDHDKDQSQSSKSVQAKPDVPGAGVETEVADVKEVGGEAAESFEVDEVDNSGTKRNAQKSSSPVNEPQIGQEANNFQNREHQTQLGKQDGSQTQAAGDSKKMTAATKLLHDTLTASKEEEEPQRSKESPEKSSRVGSKLKSCCLDVNLSKHLKNLRKIEALLTKISLKDKADEADFALVQLDLEAEERLLNQLECRDTCDNADCDLKRLKEYATRLRESLTAISDQMGVKLQDSSVQVKLHFCHKNI